MSLIAFVCIVRSPSEAVIKNALNSDLQDHSSGNSNIWYMNPDLGTMRSK